MSDRQLHFLVVDDDSESRATIAEYLRAMGHAKVSLAKDGSDAYRLVERDPTINFIISDWDMPLMNGFSLLQRVKANPARAHIPFLIVTSPVSEEAEKIVMAAENLVDAYVIKPFRSATLQEKIEKVLEVPVHGPQKQVVVVDDDADSREMVVEYVKGMGFKDVHPVADGKAALSYLAQNASKIGLIVSDWEMPELNGVELLRACKNHPVLSEVPFLMVTSQSSIERTKVLQAARSNVDQYLLKPFTSGDMRKRVEYLIEKSRNRSQVLTLTQEGLEHLEFGRYQRAQSNFEEALALDPEYDIALRGLGEVLFKVKGVEAALPYFKKAVEANPSNPKGYLRLASAYEQVGLTDKAVSLLQSANQQISFSAELHFHLGRLYNRKNMLLLAKAEFEKTLEIQLDHQEARVMLEMMGHGRTSKE